MKNFLNLLGFLTLTISILLFASGPEFEGMGWVAFGVLLCAFSLFLAASRFEGTR